MRYYISRYTCRSYIRKNSYGLYLDGKVTCVVGTHTHVQTADNRILPKGTAYISDLGMVGPYNSSLGINVNNAIDKFITCRPVRFEMAEGPNIFFCCCFRISRR